MGRRADIHFAILEHVQAHQRDGVEIDVTMTAIRIATAAGPCGLLINEIEELVAKAAEQAGVPAGPRQPNVRARGSLPTPSP